MFPNGDKLHVMTILTKSSFVICNNGYTIERYIHGWDESYNDIQPWDIEGLPRVFGAKDKYKGYKVKTRDELRQLFANQEFASAPYLQVRSTFIALTFRLCPGEC